MYRFLLRPKWLLFHVAIVASVVLMLSLANWQWTKHLARDKFVTAVQHREDAEPQELAPMLAAGKTSADIEWYRVTASGSYLAKGELLEINRTQNGVNGVNVLTPFQIDGGPIIIVNRGFVPDGITVTAAPTGTLIVGGTARATETRKTGELTDVETPGNTEVRRVDLALIAKVTNLQLAPVFIDLIASKPASATPPVPVPPPNLGSGPPHVSYTVQWIFFSMCAIAGWVFAVRRSAKTRRQAATGEPPATPSA
jgi:cytochrome oxidase assembly protein ShyY1